MPRSLVAILLCALAAAGCAERTEPVGPPGELFPLTVTSAERPVTISAPPARIIVLRGGPEAILEAIGAGNRVKGTDVAPDEVDFLRPDLVVAASGIDEKAHSQAAGAGAPVYIAPDRSITEVERAISQLGLVVAEPAAARRLVRDIEQRRRRVARALRGVPPTRIFVDVGGLASVSDSSLAGDLIREARGTNVAGDTPDFTPMLPARLLSLDPQVWVSIHGSGATLKELRRSALLRKVTAVRNGRVYVIDARLLFTPGPDIGRGLEKLAQAIHPDAFR